MNNFCRNSSGKSGLDSFGMEQEWFATYSGVSFQRSHFWCRWDGEVCDKSIFQLFDIL